LDGAWIPSHAPGVDPGGFLAFRGRRIAIRANNRNINQLRCILSISSPPPVSNFPPFESLKVSYSWNTTPHFALNRTNFSDENAHKKLCFLK